MSNDLKCPRCESTLGPMEMVGVHIDVCPMCNGCWLDRNEINQLTRSRGSNAVVVELVGKNDSYIPCPRCKAKTLQEGHHAHRPGLLLDECKQCGGVWLDRGELPTLLSIRKAH